MLCLFWLFIEYRIYLDRLVLIDLNELVCNLFLFNILYNWICMFIVVFDFFIFWVFNVWLVKIFFGYIFKLEIYLCFGWIKG